MNPENGPVFLARKAYFRRRLMDAARLLPVLGAGLFVLPLLWKSPAEGEGTRTVLVMLYLFLCWIALAGLAWLVSRRLAEPSKHVVGNGTATDAINDERVAGGSTWDG